MVRGFPKKSVRMPPVCTAKGGAGKMEPSGRCRVFKQLIQRAELVAQRLPAGKQLI